MKILLRSTAIMAALIIGIMLGQMGIFSIIGALALILFGLAGAIVAYP